MKRIIIIALLAVASVQAQIKTTTHTSGVAYAGYSGMTQFVNSVTITNVPVLGETLDVNGTVLTFTTNASPTSSQVLIGASVNASATNLYTKLAATNILDIASVALGGTNVVNLLSTGDSDTAFTITGDFGESAAVSTNTTYFGYATIATTAFTKWIRMVNYSAVRVYYTIGSTNSLIAQKTDCLDATGDTGGSDRVFIEDFSGQIYLLGVSGKSNQVGYIKGTY